MKQFLLFLFLAISISTSAQQNFNQHNPYVSNAEIHWLRQQEINLFNAPIVDDAFTANIRKTIDYKSEYFAANAKYYAVSAGTIFFYVGGIAGILFDNRKTNFTMRQDSGVLTGLSIGAIIVAIGSSMYSYKLNVDRKLIKSKFKQQLQVTRDQYSMLKGD